MRAPNKAVWRFIYSQLFVSVTGYLAIPDWTGRMSSCNAFLMLSHIEIFPYLVKECSSRKQETWLRSPVLLCTSLSQPACLTRTIQLQLLQHYRLGHRLGLLWYCMVCLGNKQRSFCHFWDAFQVLHFGLLLTMMATPFLLRDFYPQ